MLAGLHHRDRNGGGEAPPETLVRVNGIAPSSRPWHSRILLLNHTRKIGVPSRGLTGNLTLRTRRLCGLSYGDKASHLRSVSFTDSCPACGSLELLRARRCEMVGVPGNAPGLGTDLVRFRL